MAILKNNYQVGILDVGPSNHITNMGIISILEDIGCRHSDIAGLGINDITNTHLSWVLLSWKIKLLKRVPYGSKLEVHTWAKFANKFYTYRDFEILDENNNTICIATSKWALIDTKKSSITTITDEILNRYNPEINNIFSSPEIEKLTEPNTYSSVYTYTVQRRDIDINNHMNNLNYLYVAYESLPEEVYSSPECNNIEIMYKKAIKLGDTIKCFYSYQDDAHYISLKSYDEKTLHAIIKLYN